MVHEGPYGTTPFEHGQSSASISIGMSVDGMLSYHVPVESSKVTGIVSVDIPTRQREQVILCVLCSSVTYR